MSITYEDLIVCKFDGCDKPYLFRATPWSNIKAGDEVLVETRHGNKHATALGRELFEVGSERYEFIIEASGATLPLKRVLGYYKYTEFDYKEEE